MTKTAKASEDVAYYLASKGATAIAQMQAAVARAWDILADAETPLAAPDWIPVPYSWEGPEDLPHGTRSTIWRTCVEDFATGEGHTVIFSSGSPYRVEAALNSAAYSDVDGQLGCTAT